MTYLWNDHQSANVNRMSHGGGTSWNVMECKRRKRKRVRIRNIRTLEGSEASLLDYKRSQVWLRTMCTQGLYTKAITKLAPQGGTQPNTVETGQAVCYHR